MSYLMNIHADGDVAQICWTDVLPLLLTSRNIIAKHPDAVCVIIKKDCKEDYDDPIVFDSRYDSFKIQGRDYWIDSSNRPSKEEDEDDLSSKS